MQKLVVTFALVLAACGSPSEDGEAPPMESEAVASAPTEPLSSDDLVRVCRAAAAFRGSESVADVSGTVAEINLVRLSYTRQSDQKLFKYDCRVEGSRVDLRMIDEAGPGTGPSGWSGKGSTITHSINAEGVQMTESFGPGDSLTEFVAVQ
ncbi:hypothetical protein [Pontixanthobacter gangjinensis]|uniref:Lipoprotein n=1 Tax=Pontixanthobacter gangjinensis TaxID=1028742 RepID=A0A6I4SN48_9SPHN|nr:hypothetical protein [Pontixanthobacter gangjinensis]MXO57173.1 hypothetical protein [Pontixanthobacter gangjinensis]